MIGGVLADCCVVQAAIAAGQDWDRIKHLHVPAEEAEKFGRKKKNATPDEGFSGVN